MLRTIKRSFSLGRRLLAEYPYNYAEGPASVIGNKLSSERPVDEVDVLIVGGMNYITICQCLSNVHISQADQLDCRQQ